MSSRAFDETRLARLRATMKAHVERGEMPGLVYALHRGGETVIEATGDQAVSGSPMRDDTIFRIASMSKPILGAATMMLVEECVLRLDDPVDGLLPELSDMRVLKRREGPVDDTVPANRPITLRDLLTMQAGLGIVMQWPARFPIQHALEDAGVAAGPVPFDLKPDEFLSRLGSLPLVHQPGEGWMYQTCYDVLGILVSRAAGKPLGDFLRERLFEPLGMKDTGFFVPKGKLDRFATLYGRDRETGKLAVEDEARDGWYSGKPAHDRAGAELVSTASDYIAFCHMMLNGGRFGEQRLLSRPSVELMTMDHTPDALKSGPDAAMFFQTGGGWGFQTGVTTKRTHSWTNIGRFGWDGGYGTSGYTDPEEGLIGILLTQRMMDSPQPQAHYVDFWTAAYAALAD
jgi:CubicO group peptidase (beta-lactamase class C family)